MLFLPEVIWERVTSSGPSLPREVRVKSGAESPVCSVMGFSLVGQEVGSMLSNPGSGWVWWEGTNSSPVRKYQKIKIIYKWHKKLIFSYL